MLMMVPISKRSSATLRLTRKRTALCCGSNWRLPIANGSDAPVIYESYS